MKFRDSNLQIEKRRKNASVLIIVLWIAIGLVSIALYFAFSMTFELRASDNRVTGLAADQAIEGAARYVNYVLVNYATNGAVPDKTQFSAENVPVGDAHFWIIGRDPSSSDSTDPYFGLVDESSKLNLNYANTNALSYLPNMTSDFAQAIVDWRSTNSTMSLNYSSLGYEDKNSPFETVDELRLIYGATMDLLVGNDINRNGVLDAGETSTSGSTLNSGLLEYATIYSREPNFHSDGTMLTNIANDQGALQTVLQTDLGSSRAQQIMAQISSSFRGATPNFASLLQLYVNSGMNSTEFSEVANDLTVTTNLYTYGRVNVNTASEDVLTALFTSVDNGDEQTAQSAAQTLVTYRQQNPNNLGSIAWIADALGNTSEIVRALETRDVVTTKSFQFTADIAAVGAFGRGYRRVKFIFDISDGTPKILYRQDLSGLGWALGEKVRENLVAQETQ
jgi:DNA uptake protein ComE-like DNA-binding protein